MKYQQDKKHLFNKKRYSLTSLLRFVFRFRAADDGRCKTCDKKLTGRAKSYCSVRCASMAKSLQRSISAKIQPSEITQEVAQLKKAVDKNHKDATIVALGSLLHKINKM